MILFKYILKNHLAPFVFSFFTLMSVFLLQFLMKFADKLIGKGLSFWVITKLVTYSLGWMVVLTVPMAVLVATLMAFGNMAQNNEVAIMKSSGISLYKMMVPPLLASIVVAFLLIQFNNYVYPNTNLAARLLTQDISRKKPTLSLVPGVFSQEVQNYSILVRDIEPETNNLKLVTIYDYSNPSSINVVTAKEGKIYFSRDQKKLIMDLKYGEIHERDRFNKNSYRKLKFEKHKIAMNADQFSFQQSALGGPRSDRELGAQDMLVIVDSLELVRMNHNIDFSAKLDKTFKIDSADYRFKQKPRNLNYTYLRVEEKVRTAQHTMRTIIQRMEINRKAINRYWVEIHKKYSIPAACIIFILIGAPLGTMTRRGGFGVAAGISLLFFLVYWAFLIGGEKLSDRGLLSPFWGMWSANILLGVLGVYLLIKSARERITINFQVFNKLIPKQWRYVSEDDQNT